MRKEDARRREEAKKKAEVLVEALPWIHKMSGKTMVVKYGGAAMEDQSLCRSVLTDIELLKLMGVRVVLEREGIDTGRPSDLKLLSVIEQIS